MMPWSSPGIKPVASSRVDHKDSDAKSHDDGRGEHAARDDPPYDRRITACDAFDEAIKRSPHKRQKNESEPNGPPQFIGQISNAAQDERPAKQNEQPDSQSARSLHVARDHCQGSHASHCSREGVA